MPGVIATRIAVETDADAVLELVRRCIADMRARGIDQWDEIYPDRQTILGDIEAGSLHIASTADEPLVGVFTLDAKQDPRWAVANWSIADVPIAVVHRLMVEPRLHGRGLAHSLMQIAESRARDEGFGAMRLDCFSDNPQALRLYQRLGYRDAGGAALRKGLFRCLEKRL